MYISIYVMNVVCVYIYIYIHIHTYIHIHIWARGPTPVREKLLSPL